MRVLLIQTDSLFPSKHGGGKANKMLMEELSRRSIDSHVCFFYSPLLIDDGFIQTLDNLKHSVRLLEYESFAETRYTVSFIHQGVSYFGLSLEMKNILSSVRRFINTINPDRICVSEIGGLLAENLYAELKPVAAKKMVYLPKTIECLPFGTESIEKNKAITQVVQNCRTIVAASSYVSDYVSDNLNRETYFSYFPLYHPSKERSKYSPESKVTLFNGCLWKGLPVLLQCAEQLRDIKFRVVASWGTTSSDRIEASTYDNVEIVEFNHNVSEYLDASNCVIVPSIIKEAFGQIVIQSMLKGVPVIASTEGGLRESKLGVEWNLPVTPLNNKQKLRKATYKCSDTYVEEWCQKLSIMTSDAQEWTRVSKKSYVAAGAFVKSISWDNIVNTVLT